MNKRVVSIGLTAAMALTAFGGTMAVSAEEKTVVKFQTWNPGDDDATKECIAAFEAANPDIEIEFVYMPYTDHVEKLKIDLAAGDAADVYGMQTGATYEEFRDFEMDLTDYFTEKYGEDWTSEYNEYCMSLLNTDGRYYALPLGLTYAGFMWSNETLLAEYGVESVPTSLDELKAAAQTLRDQGQYPLAIGAKDAWINIDTWMNIANDIDSEKLYSAIEGETSFTDEALVESFAIWQSLFTDGVFQDGALGVGMYTDTTDLYEKEGSIPMILNGSWTSGCYMGRDSETDATFNGEGANHKIALIDWNNDGTVAPVTASVDVCLCVNKDSKVADAALRFADFMAHEGQDILVNKYLYYCPSRTNLELNVEGLSEDGLENLEYIVEQAQVNVAGYREMSYPELKQVITDNLTLLALGEITPEAAAETIEAASQVQER